MDKTSFAGQRLPEEVVKLGWISFFTDVASEMIYPVVPLFLTSVLGTPVLALGFIEGIAEAIVSVMKGVSGWHCDRIGRRVPYIRWGYGMGAASKPLLALAFSWPMVFVARIVDRLGKGLRTTARDALIADAAPSSLGGRAYGFNRMMDTAGALAGVLIAAGLLDLFPGRYRTIFLIAALPGLVAVWLTFKLCEASPPTGNRAVVSTACQPSPGKPWAELPRSFWATLGLFTLFAFANSSDAFLILRAKTLGLSDVQAILAYTLFNLVYALSSYPLGALSDRVGRWRMVISGWSLYAVVYFGFAWASLEDVWWLFPLYGLFMGLTDGIGRALIRDKIPEKKKGTAMGVFHMAIGLAALAGSVAAGLLWDVMGPRAPFLLDGTVACAAVLAASLAAPRIRAM